MSSNGAEGSTGSPRTVRVRIAVAVNERGEWCCAGWTGGKDEDHTRSALETSEYHGGTLEAIHFVEADVPLPVSQTVEGEVRA
jgi:hypothetical protein